MSHIVEIDLHGRTITLETGKIAKQANGAVVVRSGDSVPPVGPPHRVALPARGVIGCRGERKA